MSRGRFRSDAQVAPMRSHEGSLATVVGTRRRHAVAVLIGTHGGVMMSRALAAGSVAAAPTR